jgi:hypothetical protein
MNQNKGLEGFPYSEFMKSTTDWWLSAARGWQESTLSLSESFLSATYSLPRLPLWGAFNSLPSPPGTFPGNAKKDLGWLNALLQVMGPGRMSGDISRLLTNNMPAAAFEINQDALRVWSDIYERAVQPLLKVPRVGLTRVFQEKISRLVDNFNTYQTTLSEFQMLLSGPMDKSFADIKEQLKRAEGKAEQAVDYRTCYAEWIKSLEGHYMTLFRSGEYRVALARLLDQTAAFRMSGNDVLNEFLQFLPIPTNKEMDELYRDLYTLKKAAKEGAKRIGKLESALAGHKTFPPGLKFNEGDVQ